MIKWVAIACLFTLAWPAPALANAWWALCGSEDPKVAIPACDRIISNPRLKGSTLARAYVARGVSYLRADNAKKAFEDFDIAVQLDPGRGRWYYARAAAAFQKHDFAQAAKDYTAALEKGFADSTLYFGRGAAFLWLKDLDHALTDLDRAISLAPSARAFHLRALAHALRHDLDSALRDFDEVVRLDPQSSEAYLHRGLTYFDRGESDQAMADFDKSIGLSPNAPAYTSRGRLFFHIKDLEKATADYQEALRLDSGYADVYVGLAELALHRGDYDLAFEQLNRAIRLDLYNYQAYYRRAQASLDSDRPAQALADFRTALTLVPEATPDHRRILKKIANIETTQTADIPQELWHECLGGHSTQERIRSCTLIIDSGTQRARSLAKAYSARGNAYHAVGEEKLAAADHQRATELSLDDLDDEPDVPFGPAPSIDMSAPVTYSPSGEFKFYLATPEIGVLEGEMARDSFHHFSSIIDVALSLKIVVLNSVGGSVSAGVEIAEAVRQRELTTVVPDGFQCYSACTYILFAGRERGVLGKLGVHQLYSESPDLEGAQRFLSRVVKLLNASDISLSVAELMLATPPAEIHVFDQEDMVQYRITTPIGNDTARSEQIEKIIGTQSPEMRNEANIPAPFVNGVPLILNMQ